jgi:hypothetical protein
LLEAGRDTLIGMDVLMILIAIVSFVAFYFLIEGLDRI